MNNYHNYWKNPYDGNNEPYKYLNPRAWQRSIWLFLLFNKLISPLEKPKILELGSGIGRNLALLHFGNYTDLTGIEISHLAVKYMHDVFPLLNHLGIIIAPLETIIYSLPSYNYDIVFSMAVLEHLPYESEPIFKEIVRITKKYLVTIEDEITISNRHFPRQYKKIFERLGMKQISSSRKIDGLSKKFICRVFRHKRN